jgi:tetratricopeptide (TPR) repeat protein
VAIDANFALAHAMKARVLAYDYPGEVARAIAIDPDSAPLVAAELERLVIATADRALALDPELGLAHAALGVMHMRAWRRRQAEAAFARALELSPHDAEVLRWASFFESLAGNSGRAIDLMQRAAEIDPENSIFDLAEAYFFAREFDTAAAIHQQLLADDDPDSGSYRFYAEVETARGNCGVAVENFMVQEALGLGGAGARTRTAYAYSLCGRPDDASRILATMAELTPSLIQQAVGRLSAGDDEDALRLLRAEADSDLPLPGSALTVIVKNNLYNDPLLERPEFVEVRSRLGFGDQ